MPSANHTEPLIHLTIGTDEDGIAVRDLSLYLHFIRGAYVRCLALDSGKGGIVNAEALVAAGQSLAHAAIAFKPPLQGYALSGVSSTNLPSENDLLLFDIHRRNPLELVLGGVGLAVVAAIIISGGEFKVGLTGVHFKVNSLGDGIRKIKSAFARGSNTPRRITPTSKRSGSDA